MGPFVSTNEAAPEDDNFLHDLAISLTSLRLNLDLIRSKAGIADKKYIERALMGWEQINLMLQDRRGYFIRKEGMISVLSVIDELISLFQTGFESRGIRIIKDHGSDYYIKDHKDKLVRIIINILKNSIDSLISSDDKQIKIITRMVPGYFILMIKDNGKGFDKDIRHWLFKSRVSSKLDGSGRGLIIVKEYMERYFKGRVMLGNNKIKGVFIKLVFPIA